MLTHICICTPVTRNWRIKPYAGGTLPSLSPSLSPPTPLYQKQILTLTDKTDNCTIRAPLYIVIAVMNVTSDLVIMIIPIPLLIKLQVPLHRKLILAAMFCSGIFIMICTILRAYYSLKSLTTLSIALGWANRECFVAAIVVSLPGIKPLFRNSRWLGSSNRGKSSTGGPSSYPYGGYGSTSKASAGNTKTYISSLISGNHNPRRHFELDDVTTTTNATKVDADEGKRASTASKELILGDDSGIRVTTEYTLEHEGSPRRERRGV